MDSSTKNLIYNEILDILNNEDVKSHIKKMFRPIIDMLLVDIYPYIMLSLSLIHI